MSSPVSLCGAGKPQHQRLVDQFAVAGSRTRASAAWRGSGTRPISLERAPACGPNPHDRDRRRRPAGGESEDGRAVDIAVLKPGSLRDCFASRGLLLRCDPCQTPLSPIIRRSPTHENRLAQETSPYLLQHKHNPVDWWAWGPEALAEAKADNKPILLSVGYAACHWCHVMAHESFEDDATAA